MKKILHPRPIGPHWLRWLLFGAASFCMGTGITLAVQMVDLKVLPATWGWILAHPANFIMTVLIYSTAVYVLGALTGRLWIGAIPVGAAGLILALVSYFKNAINGTPLNLADFGLAAQAGNVAGLAGDLTPPMDFWQAVILVALCVLLLFLTQPLTVLEGRPRFLTFGISLALAVWLYSAAGAQTIGALLQIDFYNRTDPTEGHSLYGLTLNLWRDYFLKDMTSSAKFMEGEQGGAAYSPAYMQDILTQIDEILQDSHTSDMTDTSSTPAPNILFILSESFFDITRLPELSYDKDPVENFHALKEESISGTFHSHYLGYGTGYIEMSMLYGINSLDIPPSFNLCFLDQEAYERFDSLAEQYTHTGNYRAEMLHGFDNSLYNRTVTYPLLGFENLLFSQDIQNLGFEWSGSCYGGYYLKDSYLFQGMLKRMEDINADGRRAFLYGITMENHQPFDPDKFNYACQIGLTANGFTTEQQDIIRVMLEGITRADQALGKLTDALRESDEPTIVVFFGDHRPNLFMPDQETIYTKLGLSPGNDIPTWSPDQINDLFSTDYLIWANDAALLHGQAGTRRDSSVTALGPQLLKLTGQPISRYWDLLEKVSHVCLSNLSSCFVDGQSNAASSRAAANLPSDKEHLLDLRDAVIYDALYGKQYITAAMNEPAGSALP